LVTGSPFKRQVEVSVARYSTLKTNVKIEDKDKGKVLLVHVMNVYARVEIQLEAFFTAAVDGFECSDPFVGRITPRRTR
jgi:hypothetical protein